MFLYCCYSNSDGSYVMWCPQRLCCRTLVGTKSKAAQVPSKCVEFAQNLRASF